jgi:hypothetical protein
MHVTDVKKMVAKRVSSSPGNCSIHDQTKKFLFRSKDNNFPFFSFSIDFESKAIPGRGLGTQARIHSDRKKIASNCKQVIFLHSQIPRREYLQAPHTMSLTKTSEKTLSSERWLSERRPGLEAAFLPEAGPR